MAFNGFLVRGLFLGPLEALAAEQVRDAILISRGNDGVF